MGGVGEPRVLEMLGAQDHRFAAALAHRQVDVGHLPVADDGGVERVGHPRYLAEHVRHAAADGEVEGDHAADGDGGRGDDELEPLALARLHALAIAPRGILGPARLADAHHVVGSGAHQRDVLAGRRDTAGRGHVLERADGGFALVERREIPTGAALADDPGAGAVGVVREPPSHRQARRATVPTKRAGAEAAGREHGLPYGPNREMAHAAISHEVEPETTRSRTISPVSGPSRMPFRPWPVA